MIYLDNAATTFRKPQTVLKAMQNYMKKQGGNPGRGSHLLAMRAADVIYDTRVALARLISALPEQIALMPSATVALNTVICGILKPGDHAILSAYEHNAVLRPVHALCDYTVCKTVRDAEEAIRPQTKLLAVCHASNVNGKVQDIAGFIRLSQKTGVPLLVDASQTLGHLPLSADGIDFLVSSGHKGLFGPQGTAFLYVKKGNALPPLIRGGTGILSESPTQPELFPESLESGTLNGVGFAGLKAGAEFVYRQTQDTALCLTEFLKESLCVIPKVRIYSPLFETTAPCVAFNIAGADCVTVSEFLSERYGICVRSGLHCAPLAHNTLGTVGSGAIRASVSCFTSKKELEKFLNVVDMTTCFDV